MGHITRQCAISAFNGLKSAQIIEGKAPILRCPRQVLVRVHSASLNPLDTRMAEGYGNTVLSTLRETQTTLLGERSRSVFPLVLGRDFSGTVIDAGPSAVNKFKPETEVIGVTLPSGMGSHQETVAVDMSCVVKKPKKINHSIATSVPYAGLSAWAALFTTGGLSRQNSSQQRILVLGASGGVGSIATQLARAYNAEVIAVGGPESEEALKATGSIYLNYKDDNYAKDLISLSGFDIILDSAGFGSKSSDLAPLLRTGGCIVSMDSPLLKNTDKQGLLLGSLSSVAELITTNINTVGSGKTVRWAYFSPTEEGLSTLCDMLEDGSLNPLIDRTFKFTDVLEAYKYFTEEKTKGKVILSSWE